MINPRESHYYPKYWSSYGDLKFNCRMKHQAESIVVFSVPPRQMSERAESVVGSCGLVSAGTCVTEAGIPWSRLWEGTVLLAFSESRLVHGCRRRTSATQSRGTNSWAMNLVPAELFPWHLPYLSLGFIRKKINRWSLLANVIGMEWRCVC